MIINYSEELNLPEEKITSFAKYVVDYYIHRKRRRKFKGTLNEVICRHLLTALNTQDPNNVAIYTFILGEYNIKPNIVKYSSFFTEVCDEAVRNNLIQVDYKGRVCLSEKHIVNFENTNLEELENDILRKAYSDLLYRYGEKSSWKDILGRAIWDNDLFEVMDPKVSNLMYRENSKLGLGYIYKNVILKEHYEKNTMRLYFDED